MPALPLSVPEAKARNWHVVHVPPHAPNCDRKGWQTTPSELEEFGPEDGIGVVLGPSGLVDVDLDCAEAAIIAPLLLPATATFGRAGKEATHWVYNCAGARSGQWVDAELKEAEDKKRALILEIRGGPLYTLFPPSTHWKSGTPVEWDDPNAEIAGIAENDLRKACRLVSFAVLLGRGIPDGSRHNAALAAAGCLALAGFSMDEAMLTLRAVGALWWPLQAPDGNVDAGVRDTYAKHAQGLPLMTWRGLSAAGLSDQRIESAQKALGTREGLVVIEASTNIGENVDAILRQLRASDAPLFDAGGGRLVRAVEGQLQDLTEAGLLEEIGRLCVFHRGGKPLTKPPREVVTALQARGSWPTLRHLRGVSHAPVVRPDGSVSVAVGYDDESQVWARTFLPATTSTREGAMEGLATLVLATQSTWWKDDEDQLAWIAHVMTHAARYALPANAPVPVWLYTANAAGSGKTTLAQRASWVTLGAMPGPTTITRGGEEWSKTLFSSADREVLLLDNLRGRVESVELEAAVLSGQVTARRFHTQETVTRPWRPIVALTANGATLGSDLSRRVIPVRLERPVDAEAYSGDLVLDREAMLRAALSIVRGYLASGETVHITPWQSYDAWNRVIPASLAWLGCGDLVAHAQASIASVDAEREERMRVIRALHEFLAASGWLERGASANEICQESIGNSGPGDTKTRRELQAVLREVLETRRGTMTVRGVGHYLGTVGLVPGYASINGKVSSGVRRWAVRLKGNE